MSLDINDMGKNLVKKEFNFYYNTDADNKLMLGLKNIDSDSWLNISNQIDNNNFDIYMEDAILYLELKNEIYSFDLKSYLSAFFARKSTDHFYIAFCFVEENNEIREERVNQFRMNIV